MAKGSKRNKLDSAEVKFRLGLDTCSKRGDAMGAIRLYDLALREGIKMGQYHYAVLLYLCSSAAVGVVQPAKSGSRSRALNSLEVSNEVTDVRVVDLSELRDKNDRNAVTELHTRVSNNGDGNPGSSEKMELNSSSGFNDLDNNFNEENLNLISNVISKPNCQYLDGVNFCRKGKNGDNRDDHEIQVNEDIKKYALRRGFEIYDKMCMDKVPMNEATLTAVARMAMSMGNGDMAFDMVKQMKPLGLNPRLRSYGPALSTFCNNGDVNKAFAVEKHMLEHGVHPEEPELEALLRVSVEAGKGDKVYYLLHKLRTSVRKVSPSTADIIVRWFKSKAASRVGKTKWDKRVIKEAIENGGGGWHGQGWLGKGKWSVSITSIGPDAFCRSCGEKLATIDLDPTETQNFAESVASIAIKRDKDSSFQRFQKWLNYYGPFEAVIDGANVGLLSEKRFIPSKINAIANGIRQKLPSKRWPLIVLHNKRVTGPNMNEAANKALTEKWKNADALYATPTGSNDDWYWLYAAIKFKCLIVTNDEMRDHTFQLLGNDFFPKWKERHQVHFSFSDVGPVFHMPPCFSAVIQESEKGNWHIPIATDHDYDPERTWLCITRANSSVARHDSITTRTEDSQSVNHSNEQAMLTKQNRVKEKQEHTLSHCSLEDLQNSPQEVYKNLRNVLLASGFTDHHTILSDIEAAEKLSGRELRDLRSQLHYAADYCEATFLNAKEKRMVVESTKDYICRAVVAVVDHLGCVSANLDNSISKNNEFSEAELRINSLNQRLLSCEQYAQKLALKRVRWSANLPKFHRRYLSAPITNVDIDKSTEDERNPNSPATPMIIAKHGFEAEDLPLFFCTQKPSLALPARDGLSILSKGPNPTFHFQINSVMDSDSVFGNVVRAPEDPILGVTVAYNKDTSPNKLNLGVGAYRTELTIFIPSPTWGNHPKVFTLAGLSVKTYRYYDPATRGWTSMRINLTTYVCMWHTGLLEDLGAAPEGSIVLLHACAHNPTGVDPTPDQWEQIRQLIRSKALLPFFDSAYQGFASGSLDADAQSVRMFVADGGECLIAQSYAKNMGLYGERVGALSIVCKTADVASRVESQLKLVIRPMYSNPPIHGASIVATILKDRDMYNEWTIELKAMADRIITMRQQLFDALSARGTPGDWSHIIKQIGMFTFTGLNSEQVAFMTKDYHIYMTSDGRISMAGLSSKTVPHLADAIHAAVARFA
ncbi:hypothetical protein GH714_039164 [Hevea brasiliensis]|uniref:Aspartate aminotransferase n=1 Tax=Hevea brasiliensis TaxID=3981 RepID=A0A6A6LX88_HEVBR|nr:hypothetical protein GH714_039164 [Hevea brasiliensis]